MKAFHSFGRIAVLVAVVTSCAAHASAQSEPRISRADVAGTVGWLSADTHPSGLYNDNNWANSFLGAVSAGWHWTDNLKTEVDFGVGSKARVFTTEQIVIDKRVSYVTTDSKFARRTLGLSQQYQFFHNVWFHPHVAAGAHVTWERRTDRIIPIYIYEQLTGTSRTVTLPQNDGPQTSLTVRPFVAVGFKAYMTERMFFRHDFRVAFRGGPDEAVLRLGFGFDF